jgi:hypothetical protein
VAAIDKEKKNFFTPFFPCEWQIIDVAIESESIA